MKIELNSLSAMHPANADFNYSCTQSAVGAHAQASTFSNVPDHRDLRSQRFLTVIW